VGPLLGRSEQPPLQRQELRVAACDVHREVVIRHGELGREEPLPPHALAAFDRRAELLLERQLAEPRREEAAVGAADLAAA
jgi:hypothetical protein